MPIMRSIRLSRSYSSARTISTILPKAHSITSSLITLMIQGFGMSPSTRIPEKLTLRGLLCSGGFISATPSALTIPYTGFSGRQAKLTLTVNHSTRTVVFTRCSLAILSLRRSIIKLKTTSCTSAGSITKPRICPRLF